MMRRNRQSGMALYAALSALVVFGGMAVAIKVQMSRLDAIRQEYAAFRAQVEAAGKAAQAEAARVNAENAKRKAKYDKEISSLRAANADLNRRLLDSASQSSLSGIPSPAGQPHAACFDRPSLDEAIRRFTAGTARIAAEGGRCVAELDNARRWAQDR